MITMGGRHEQQAYRLGLSAPDRVESRDLALLRYQYQVKLLLGDSECDSRRTRREYCALSEPVLLEVAITRNLEDDPNMTSLGYT